MILKEYFNPFLAWFKLYDMVSNYKNVDAAAVYFIECCSWGRLEVSEVTAGYQNMKSREPKKNPEFFYYTWPNLKSFNHAYHE